ncbi:hypothetical protein GCM10027360_55410 [Amycolatopsis echigonensis]|uniref:Uncharacterized protein n=1 Tax=Amycolatopsis tucumanensis TaxID=401106 RepID=A0ABP7IKX4_9PSEU
MLLLLRHVQTPRDSEGPSAAQLTDIRVRGDRRFVRFPVDHVDAARTASRPSLDLTAIGVRERVSWPVRCSAVGQDSITCGDRSRERASRLLNVMLMVGFGQEAISLVGQSCVAV